ncbi:hypothetical protein KQI84_00190 [bacterium]|nr:hypothetical protein [bacterium]
MAPLCTLGAVPAAPVLGMILVSSFRGNSGQYQDLLRLYGKFLGYSLAAISVYIAAIGIEIPPVVHSILIIAVPSALLLIDSILGVRVKVLGCAGFLVLCGVLLFVSDPAHLSPEQASIQYDSAISWLFRAGMILVGIGLACYVLQHLSPSQRIRKLIERVGGPILVICVDLCFLALVVALFVFACCSPVSLAGQILLALLCTVLLFTLFLITYLTFKEVPRER